MVNVAMKKYMGIIIKIQLNTKNNFFFNYIKGEFEKCKLILLFFQNKKL